MPAKKRANGEGTISQHPDGRWWARITLADGKRKAYYGKTRKEVQQKLTAALRDLQQGIAPVPERLTVAQWLTHWLNVTVRPPARRLNTYLGYKTRIEKDILPHLGNRRLNHLQPHEVEA